MPKNRISILALLAAAASTTAAASILSDSLLERASSSCTPGFSQCTQAGLPSNFCCGSTQFCILLAGNTTVLCCPTGSDCRKITPIACDLNLQNASSNPQAPIKTTALTGSLGHCSDGTCCPWGYTCNGSGQCEQDANQNIAPNQNTSSSTPSSVPVGTATGVPTTEPTTGAAQSPSPSPSSGGSGGGSYVQTMSIVFGVVGGVLGLVIALVLAWVISRRRQKRAAALNVREKHSSTSSFGNILANPVVISSPKLASESSAYRTDFIRKSPTLSLGLPRRPSSRASRFVALGLGRDNQQQQQPRTPSPTWSRSRSRHDTGMSVPPIRGMRPQPQPSTPRAQREPSMEINVFADPSTVGRSGSNRRRRDSDDRKTTLTTFTDMMEQADLGDVRRGDPFVPGSAAATPESVATRRR